MKNNIFPKWLSRLLFVLAIFNLSAYVTMEIMFNKPVEFYRYALTFFFGLMFYNWTNKKED